MNINTVTGHGIDQHLLCNYFETLVNHFFKILPIREAEEASLPVYISSLQLELLGCKSFVPALCTDAKFLSLLNILQYLSDNPQCEVQVVKREIFKAIRICDKLKVSYSEGGAQK